MGDNMCSKNSLEKKLKEYNDLLSTYEQQYIKELEFLLTTVSSGTGGVVAAATVAAPAVPATALVGAAAAATVEPSSAAAPTSAPLTYSDTHWVPASQNSNKVCYSGNLGSFSKSECKNELIGLKNNASNKDKVLFGTWLKANNNCRYGVGANEGDAQTNCDNTSWDQCATNDQCSTITLDHSLTGCKTRNDGGHGVYRYGNTNATSDPWNVESNTTYWDIECNKANEASCGVNPNHRCAWYGNITSGEAATVFAGAPAAAVATVFTPPVAPSSTNTLTGCKTRNDGGHGVYRYGNPNASAPWNVESNTTDWDRECAKADKASCGVTPNQRCAWYGA